MRRVLSSTVILLLWAAIGSAQSPAKPVLVNARSAALPLTSPKGTDTAAVLRWRPGLARRDRETWSRSISADSRAAHVRDGAIVGGGIGAALGVVGGSLVHAGCDAGSTCSATRTRASAILTSAVIVGVVGAGVGALVGLLRSGQ